MALSLWEGAGKYRKISASVLTSTTWHFYASAWGRGSLCRVGNQLIVGGPPDWNFDEEGGQI